MTFPFHVSFRDVAIHEPLETLARERAAKLDHYHDRITSGRMVIEHDGHHPPRYHVKLELHVPGGEVIVTRGPAVDVEHQIREAFDVARRQVQDVIRRKRGDVKTHAPDASS